VEEKKKRRPPGSAGRRAGGMRSYLIWTLHHCALTRTMADAPVAPADANDPRGQ
jgi:hypothetical protein